MLKEYLEDVDRRLAAERGIFVALVPSNETLRHRDPEGWRERWKGEMGDVLEPVFEDEVFLLLRFRR